eukprot:evm.model.NODE_29139_length_15189_cov_21.076502.2
MGELRALGGGVKGDSAADLREGGREGKKKGSEMGNDDALSKSIIKEARWRRREGVEDGAKEEGLVTWLSAQCLCKNAANASCSHMPTSFTVRMPSPTSTGISTTLVLSKSPTAGSITYPASLNGGKSSLLLASRTRRM